MTVITMRTGNEWKSGPEDVLLGVDIVELVSSSLYVEPLAAYREYVQNSADALDDARAAGLFDRGERPRVDFLIDPTTRSVCIRDNGIGLASSDFVRRLTAFGASEKRGKQRRGFRGVGRLAALGYCQELFFRSRAAEGEPVRELRWDCRSLRSSLRAADFAGTLAEAVRTATSHREITPHDYPNRFFEVELRGIVRHGRDDLLNPATIRQYLGQVAPVPFAPTFRHAAAIDEFLSDLPTPADLHVFVDGEGPVYRLHADEIDVKSGMASPTELQLISIPGVNSGVAAKGWVLHHGYLGALPREQGIRGLRLRTGNIQVGDDAILASVFPEPRFYAWAIGEFHIVDARIVPNGRRDQYEHSVHLANVLNYIASIARDISQRCRQQSRHRQLLKRAENLATEIDHGLSVLQQGAVSAAAKRLHVARLEAALLSLEKIAEHQLLSTDDRDGISYLLRGLRRRLTRAQDRDRSAAPLRKMSPQKRKAFEEVFSLVFECATDVRGAKDLVDRVLARLK